MENPEHDETQPNSLNNPRPTDEPVGDETRPIPVHQEAGAAAGPGDSAPEATVPNPVAQSTPARIYEHPRAAGGAQPPQQPTRKKGISLPMLTFLGLLALLLIAAASAFSGYQSGINLRKGAESTQVASTANEQYNLAVQDLSEGRYYDARQRLEYVIGLNPAYPGAADRLSEVLLHLNTTATPTVAPTPTLTPTPDLRGVEELFSQAQQHLNNNEWSQTIDTLLSLRKADPAFHAVEVDGMLFLSLRNRGKDKIFQSDLEGGLYDLALAERFAPLDSEAQNLRRMTSAYITGASFWGIDWAQAVAYLSEVAPGYPNLRDASGMTAIERYRLGLFEYGKQLAEQGAWCEEDGENNAVAMFQASLSYGEDPEVSAALEEAISTCSGLADEDEDGDDGDGEEVPLVPGLPETQPVETQPPVDPGAGEGQPTADPGTGGEEQPTPDPNAGGEQPTPAP